MSYSETRFAGLRRLARQEMVAAINAGSQVAATVQHHMAVVHSAKVALALRHAINAKATMALPHPNPAPAVCAVASSFLHRPMKQGFPIEAVRSLQWTKVETAIRCIPRISARVTFQPRSDDLCRRSNWWPSKIGVAGHMADIPAR